MDDLTRREFVGVTAAAVTLAGTTLEYAAPATAANTHRFSLTINGQTHQIECDPRVTLLDLLRERLQLTGTKKGCDQTVYDPWDAS